MVPSLFVQVQQSSTADSKYCYNIQQQTSQQHTAHSTASATAVPFPEIFRKIMRDPWSMILRVYECTRYRRQQVEVCTTVCTEYIHGKAGTITAVPCTAVLRISHRMREDDSLGWLITRMYECTIRIIYYWFTGVDFYEYASSNSLYFVLRTTAV